MRLHHYLPLFLTSVASLTAAAPAPTNDLAVRDGSEVVAAVNTIAEQTKTLNETVSSYDGGIVDTVTAIEIETQAIELNNDLRKAIWVTQNSDNFTTAESKAVSTAFLEMVPVVESTLANIVSKEEEFSNGLLGIWSLGFLVKYNLETEKRLALELGHEVEKRLTPVYAEIAPIVISQIKTAFTKAIEAYSDN
ncbi:antigenic cell wall galactomannoprotein [Aspergillus sp. HF37]|nr:antigenic cell wall galactomannoprotein [Aspergillus sp. HF37]